MLDLYNNDKYVRFLINQNKQDFNKVLYFDLNTQKMSKVVTNSPSRQIKQKQIEQMLQLQQLFHSRFLTQQLLSQLIAIYVQAIQCFDGIYSPMRKYFLNKIQFVVSRPEIDIMLKRNADGNSSPMDMIRETMRLTTGTGKFEEGFSQQMLMEAIETQNKKGRQQYQQNTKKEKQKKNVSNQGNRFNVQSPQMSKEPNQQTLQQQKFKNRHNKIEMQMRVMHEIEQNMKNLSEQVQKEDQKVTKKNKRINALMQEQNNTLETRLAMRRKGKNKKKSIDQKQIQEIKQTLPTIKKSELKLAQKQIEEAVTRMTIRLTQRQSALNSKGLTGLLSSTNRNTGNVIGSRNTGGGSSAQKLQQQKNRGRIKLKNQVKQEDEEDDQDLLAVDTKFNKNGIQENSGKQTCKDTAKKQQNKIDIHPTAGYQPRNSEAFGTGRFTMGKQSGGRGRIKKKDTQKVQEDQEQII